jgi:hypothetical protein
MVFGVRDSRLRRRHIQSLDPSEIAASLKEQLEQVPAEESLYKEWWAHSVRRDELERWINEVVAEAWDAHAAARAWNIINTGCDGEVAVVYGLIKLVETWVKRSHGSTSENFLGRLDAFVYEKLKATPQETWFFGGEAFIEWLMFAPTTRSASLHSRAISPKGQILSLRGKSSQRCLSKVVCPIFDASSP